jgi:hypothetical protein
LLSLCLRWWSYCLQIWFSFCSRFSVLWSSTTFETMFLTWIKKIDYLLYRSFKLAYLNLFIAENICETVWKNSRKQLISISISCSQLISIISHNSL